MAGIDKLYLSSYYDYNDLRLWCLIHNPKLLMNFYDITLDYEKWDKSKENVYNSNLKRLEKFFELNPTLQDFINHYNLIFNYKSEEINSEQILRLQEEWDENEKFLQELKINKDGWIDDKTIPCCNFTIKQDKWLLWRCPLPFIREYLEKQCGYKTKWYHKLFFVGKDDWSIIFFEFS